MVSSCISVALKSDAKCLSAEVSSSAGLYAQGCLGGYLSASDSPVACASTLSVDPDQIRPETLS